MHDGELARFERVVLPFLDDAYTLARYLVRDEHDAQDIVQEASLRALRYFGGYNGGDARAWLLAIVRNCTLTFRQKRKLDDYRAPVMDVSALEVSSGLDADSAAIAASERSRVDRALAALPQEFREVIVLREVQDLSYREISDVVGVPIGTVMSRLARARKRLAGLLEGGAREAS
jgi:RNA polymerase sigma-70 factor (ECF subfamily)